MRVRLPTSLPFPSLLFSAALPFLSLSDSKGERDPCVSLLPACHLPASTFVVVHRIGAKGIEIVGMKPFHLTFLYKRVWRFFMSFRVQDKILERTRTPVLPSSTGHLSLGWQFLGSVWEFRASPVATNCRRETWRSCLEICIHRLTCFFVYLLFCVWVTPGSTRVALGCVLWNHSLQAWETLWDVGNQT